MTLATVLVTGSSSGLGRYTVETLARCGYTVFASMRASSGKNARVASELRALARNEALDLHVIDLDVTDDESVQSAVAEIITLTGRIDVVVNNAGFGFSGISEAMLVEQVHHQFDVNLYGLLRVNQAVLPHMRRQGSGLLVYVASTASQMIMPLMGMYSATKAALAAMARGFAYEIQGLGIDTTIIQAGGFATDFGSNVMKAGNDEVWSEYGEMGQFATAFTDGMSAALAPGVVSDPQLFADLVADLIAAPRGTRPLYVPIGVGSEGFDLINQAVETVERQSLRMFSLGQFVRNTPKQLPVTVSDEIEDEWLARAA